MKKRLVYADHAATTPLCDVAWDTMQPFLRSEFGNPSSLHSWAKKPRAAVAEARAVVAGCIGADPSEIIFTSGGTESDNWAIKGTEGGLLVSAYEHHAVLNAAESEAACGREVVYVRPKSGGYLLPETLCKKWMDGIKLVSVMMANNEIGTINPIKMLTEAAHKRGALFHTDAVQAVGHIPINVRELGVDFLSASAHKFNGPKGIGFLYMRRGLKLKPFVDGGQQENGLRAGTENVAAIVGMAAALRWNCHCMEKHFDNLCELRSRLYDGITALCPDAYFPGYEYDNHLPGVLSVSFPDRSAEGIVHLLDLKGIAISSGAACDSRNIHISHVLKAIRIPRRLAMGTVRFSLGCDNSMKDIDAILSALRLVIR
jgi:cysteine desulfurase